MIAQILASIALVHSAPTAPKTHDLVFLTNRREAKQPFFYPEVATKDYPTPNFNTARLSNNDALALGKKEIAKETGLSEADIQITSSFRDAAGVMHINAQRLINGVAIDNQNAAVHVMNGQVMYISSSIPSVEARRSAPVAAAQAVISLDEAVSLASKELGLPRDDFPAKMTYIQLPSGTITYAHQFQLRDDAQERWVQVSVDAKTGQVVQVVDFVNQASFKVIALPRVTPLDGFVTVTDPANEKASPKGWNSDGETSYTDTQGNNVDSRIGRFTRVSDAGLNFDTAWDATQEPSSTANKNAAIVNNFYVSNMVHDISYQYGFTEAAGNFQQKNFGKGGSEGDRVTVYNQGIFQLM
jgi:Zn-dependent metalloprotease